MRSGRRRCGQPEAERRPSFARCRSAHRRGAAPPLRSGQAPVRGPVEKRARGSTRIVADRRGLLPGRATLLPLNHARRSDPRRSPLRSAQIRIQRLSHAVQQSQRTQKNAEQSRWQFLRVPLRPAIVRERQEDCPSGASVRSIATARPVEGGHGAALRRGDTARRASPGRGTVRRHGGHWQRPAILRSRGQANDTAMRRIVRLSSATRRIVRESRREAWIARRRPGAARSPGVAPMPEVPCPRRPSSSRSASPA